MVNQIASVIVNQDANVIQDIFVVPMELVSRPNNVGTTNNVHLVSIITNVQIFVMSCIVAHILVAVFHLMRFVISL